MVAVRARNLVKRFGETEVLKGVDLQIDDGAFAVLVGPSGCGKSTLLRLLSGLDTVSSGSIHFDEEEVTGLSARDRDVAMVFQSYALYPHMSVRGNLEFGLRRRKTPESVIDERVNSVAEMLDIAHLLERRPSALSGGQRQRVAMGRAIVRRPRLFLFDEPLSNLDPELRASVRVDIRRRHDELRTTSVYVTHDQVEAMTLADILYVLDQGVVQQSGRPIDIYQRPANLFVARFLGSPAMNFLRSRVESSGPRASVRGIQFDAEDFGGVEHGAPVILGIRPHDLRIEAEGAGHLRMEVKVIETLGPELIAHGELDDGSPLVAALPADQRVARGEILSLRAEFIHVFDPDSEESYRS